MRFAANGQLLREDSRFDARSLVGSESHPRLQYNLPARNLGFERESELLCHAALCEHELQLFANGRSINRVGDKPCADTAEPAQDCFASGVYIAHVRYINDQPFRD